MSPEPVYLSTHDLDRREIRDYGQWILHIESRFNSAKTPRLPEDWTIFPLRAMATIKCYLCEEIMRPGAPYYDAGEAVVHKHCGERIAPPKKGAVAGPS